MIACSWTLCLGIWYVQNSKGRGIFQGTDYDFISLLFKGFDLKLRAGCAGQMSKFGYAARLPEWEIQPIQHEFDAQSHQVRVAEAFFSARRQTTSKALKRLGQDFSHFTQSMC